MRRSLVALAVLAAFLVCRWGFEPESAALGWHLHHGMQAEGAGVRMRVPLLYEGLASADAMTLSTRPGKVRERWLHAPSALIMLSDKPPSPAGTPMSNQEMLARTEEQHQHLGSKPGATREVHLGKQALSCRQFEGGPYIVGVDIWCVPATGGPIVSYGGSRELVDEFYKLLQSAERTGR